MVTMLTVPSTPSTRSGTRGYFATWLALILLAGASLGLSFVHLGLLAMPVALAIAAAKAVLVATVFMHLGRGDAATRLALALAALFVVLLTSLAVADVMTRDRLGIVPPMDRVDAARP